MKKVLYVGAEALPFAATGGLGDVLGSLPCELKKLAGQELDVRVVIPLYDAVSEKWRAQMKDEAVFSVKLAWRNQYCGIKSLVKDGVTYYFVDNEYYFRRGALYGHYDDGERYAYFCKAVLEMLERIDWYPDILHAHDWQAALSVVYLNAKYRSREKYANMKTVFTIHNIEYQGYYDFAILGDVFDLGAEHRGLMQYGNCINLMKAAVECADRVTTVSQRYSEEIRTPEYSFGLDTELNRNSFKLSGILNGIDYEYYDPQHDTEIAKNYYWRTFASGKAACRKALREELGLPEREGVPVLSVISRLVAAKGVDLICAIADKLVSENDIQLVILGKGAPEYEKFFAELQERYPDKVRALITYDRALSKRIYAATDIFLMPSRSEACGLSQMIASRYGAIPVVRETGGLYDSIKGYWNDNGEIKGNGFTLANYSADELLDRTSAAIELYGNTAEYKKFVTKIMKTDFSWAVSAEKYMGLYDHM